MQTSHRNQPSSHPPLAAFVCREQRRMELLLLSLLVPLRNSNTLTHVAIGRPVQNSECYIRPYRHNHLNQRYTLNNANKSKSAFLCSGFLDSHPPMPSI